MLSGRCWRHRFRLGPGTSDRPEACGESSSQSLGEQAASSETGKPKSSVRLGLLEADTPRWGKLEKGFLVLLALAPIPLIPHFALLISTTTFSQAHGGVFLGSYLQPTPLCGTSGSSSPQSTMPAPCPALMPPGPAHMAPVFTAGSCYAHPAVDSVVGPPLTSIVHTCPASFAVDGCHQQPSEDCLWGAGASRTAWRAGSMQEF